MAYKSPELIPLIKNTVAVGEWVIPVPVGASAISAAVAPGVGGLARIDATLMPCQQGDNLADPLLIRDTWGPGTTATQKSASISAPCAALILVVTGAPAVFNITVRIGS